MDLAVEPLDLHGHACDFQRGSVSLAFIAQRIAAGRQHVGRGQIGKTIGFEW
jgi:hypothetical protein